MPCFGWERRIPRSSFSRGLDGDLPTCSGQNDVELHVGNDDDDDDDDDDDW